MVFISEVKLRTPFSKFQASLAKFRALLQLVQLVATEICVLLFVFYFDLYSNEAKSTAHYVLLL